MTDADRKRLTAILGMLGSDAEGERDNAARLAEQFRRQHGLTWDELLSGHVVTVYVDRDRIMEREVYVDRVVYVGLLGLLKGLHIDRGVAIVLGGIPLVIFLATWAQSIRAALGY
jgi:hypothetical protein